MGANVPSSNLLVEVSRNVRTGLDWKVEIEGYSVMYLKVSVLSDERSRYL